MACIQFQCKKKTTTKKTNNLKKQKMKNDFKTNIRCTKLNRGLYFIVTFIFKINLMFYYYYINVYVMQIT